MKQAIQELLRALRQERIRRKLSQRALGERIGVPQSHVSRIEQGATDPRVSTLVTLARALGLEVVLVPRYAVPAVEAIARSLEAAREGTRGGRQALAEPPAPPAYRLDEDPEDPDRA